MLTIKFLGEYLLLGAGCAVVAIVFEELGFSKISLALKVALVSSFALFMFKIIHELSSYMMGL